MRWKTPKLWMFILTLVFIGLFVRLGVWQLDRAQQKRNLLAHLQQRSHQPPIQNWPARWKAKPKQDWSYWAVSLRGRYDNQHTLYLDNQTYKGRVGYQVLTPFHLITGQTILVNRGWIPLKNTRDRLPALSPVHGLNTIQGLLSKPKALWRLSSDKEIISTWPARIQRVEFAPLEQSLKTSLLPWLVLLSPESPHGFVRDWTLSHVNPEKSVGYAWQWFAFAVTLAIIFVGLHFKRDLKDDDV